MCNQSFWGEEFKVGTSYVFPLTEVDLTNSDDTLDMTIERRARNPPSYRMFVLPTCSHTALLVNEERLYTNELTYSGGRRLEYYMRLSVLRFMFKAGLFEMRGVIVGVGVLMALLAFLVVRRRSAKVHSV
jgi:hypothetical protein